MNARFKHSQYVRETSKVSEITDKFGNLRFKVILDDRQLPGGYRVQVLAYGEDGEEEEVVNESFPVLDQAEKFFGDTVGRYVYLIKSEQHRPSDIKLYARRIGYRDACPACCATCKWSKRCDKDDRLFAEDDPALRWKFFCMHPTLFRQRDGRPEEDQVEVRPVVEALCVCNAFERAKIGNWPVGIAGRDNRMLASAYAVSKYVDGMLNPVFREIEELRDSSLSAIFADADNNFYMPDGVDNESQKMLFRKMTTYVEGETSETLPMLSKDQYIRNEDGSFSPRTTEGGGAEGGG